MSKSLVKSQAEYLTTGVVAQLCGVSKVTVLRWINKGHLNAFRLPEGHYRINKKEKHHRLYEQKGSVCIWLEFLPHP